MQTAQLKVVFVNIRAIREFRNYSQEYLALQLGISQNAYSKIELGYTNITLHRTMSIAAVLGVSIGDLFVLDLSTLPKAAMLKRSEF